MPDQSIFQILRQLEAAVAWFEAAGIRVRPGRLDGYHETLQAAARCVLADDPNVAPAPPRERLFPALCEVNDLWHIAHLPPSVVERFSHKLQAIVAAGAECYVDADVDDLARTTAFELVTAALLHRSGVPVALEEPSDVAASVGTDRILIECKRPTSIPALRRRIEEGYGQFRDHFEAGHNGFAIIAIEASRLLNPRFDVMLGLSDSDAMLRLDVELAGLLSDARSELARAARNARHRAPVDAVLFRVQCIAVDRDRPRESVMEIWRVAVLHRQDSPTFVALNVLLARLPGSCRPC